MTTVDELGRVAFMTKMADAPNDACELIEAFQQHFDAQADATTYFRKVPDLRLVAIGKSAPGKINDQVFATIQWRPRLLAFRVGAFINLNIWSKLGFEGAKLFTADPLISYITIPPEIWRKNQSELFSALEVAKKNMLIKLGTNR